MKTTKQTITLTPPIDGVQYEIWKDIEGYNGLYQVSNLGRIKSFHKVTERIKSLVPDKDGYSTVCLCLKGIYRQTKVHRLVAIYFISNPENKPQVNHKNGIKTDNKVENLEWNTQSENSKHAYRTGLSSESLKRNRVAYIREQNGNAILNSLQVSEIRSKYKKYVYSARKLALEYNVSKSCITHIINNTSWKQL